MPSVPTAPGRWPCWRRQLNSPLLLLLVAAALVLIVVGEHADAGIILVIIGLSVGLGFANEFRAERAVEALHDRIRLAAGPALMRADGDRGACRHRTGRGGADRA